YMVVGQCHPGDDSRRMLWRAEQCFSVLITQRSQVQILPPLPGITDRTAEVAVLSMDDAITAVPPACRRRLMVTCVIWGPLETVWCGGGEAAERVGVSVARRMISDRYVTARDGWRRGVVPGAACRAAGRRGDVDGAGRARAEIG